MPVIRLAGKGGGFFQQAGQAAGAYDQATADTRRQQFANERIAQQRLQQQAQLGFRAQQQDIRNQQTNRSLDLRERAIEANRVRQQMRGAVKASNGVPITGAGTIQMVTRLAELDWQTYQQLAPQLQAMAGFDESNPATPEKLDQLANLTDIYAAIAPAYAKAVKAADIHAVENGYADITSKYVEDPKVYITDPEWAKWKGEIDVALASAKIAPDGASMALMAPIYENAEKSASRLKYLQQQRSAYTRQFNEILDSGKYTDADKLQRAQRQFGRMKSTDDPEDVWADTMIELDPTYRRAHEKGIRAGQAQGMTQAAVAQVQREQAAVQRATPDSNPAPVAEPAPVAADAPTAPALLRDFPTLAKGYLGLTDDIDQKVYDLAQERGVDVSDDAALDPLIQEVMRGSMRMPISEATGDMVTRVPRTSRSPWVTP